MADKEDRRLLLTARVTFDFTGTTVLITGGTSGIGYATAVLFRDAGADLTITGTRAGPDEYDTDLAGMTYRRLILTDPSSIDELVSTTSTLDVLVNNAGANFPGGLNEADPEGFEASVAVNLTAPYRLTFGLRKTLAACTATGGASVVFLSSLSALRAVTLVPGYGAAKAGVASLTHNLAVKWAPRNIRVNAVVPGMIDTPMTELAKTVPEIITAELARIPMGRLGAPIEIASTIASCAPTRVPTQAARCSSSTARPPASE
jgi:NAD(P)-dependent dehydrogenase (short-subunit alcohol dehydrogenase family)